MSHFNVSRVFNSVADVGNEPERIRAFSDFYWRLVVSTFFAVIVAGMTYGIIELGAVLRDISTSDTSAPPPPALNRLKLNEMLHALDARKSEFNNLKTAHPVTPKDPSR